MDYLYLLQRKSEDRTYINSNIVTEVDPGTFNDGGGVGAKFPPFFTTDMFFTKLQYWQI